MSMRKIAVAAALALGVSASPSFADPTAAWEFNSSSPNYITFTDGSWDFGINFSVNSPITVSALGYFDAGNGFTDSHAVALYSAAGALLASGIVSDSDPLIGNFNYLSISPIVLGVGTYQVVGVSNSDLYAFNTSTSGALGAALVLNPAITYLGDSYNRGSTAAFVGIGAGLVNNDVLDGIFGPGLLVGVAGPSGVPEPVTLSIFGAGLLGAAAAVRRRKAKKG